MVEYEGRFTGVLAPTGDHYVMAHGAEKSLDDIDLAAIDELHALIREQAPALNLMVLSGRHYGRAIGPQGDSQLYVVADEPLSAEQRALLDRFAETGEWPWPRGGEASS